MRGPGTGARQPPGDGPEARFEAVLNSLSDPVLVVGSDGTVEYVNQATELFFDASQSWLVTRNLADLVPTDGPLFAMIGQVRKSGSSLSEYGVTLQTQRTGARLVTIAVAPINDEPGSVVVSLHDRTITSKMTGELNSRSAVRSLTGMAAVLAHEVKNPLSGIRGAAQLLEQGADDEDRKLTHLICDETDRICALLDSMDAFSEQPLINQGEVNIHQVLEHVRKLAENGFARSVRIQERYDPSLPPVAGDRDQLIQVFLNLVKNAAEAVADRGGEITITTGYQHGLRVARPGSDTRTQLPLVIAVIDNGEGIAEDIQAHLFDPFVTTKSSGTGLGLALVAKIIGDHGGMIEFTSEPGCTVFRVYLPAYRETEVA